MSTDVLLAIVVAELGIVAAQQRQLIAVLRGSIATATRNGVGLARLLQKFGLASADVEPPPARSAVAGEINAR